MTTTASDPNRALWEAQARGEQTPAWETLATQPAGVTAETVDTPAGLWLRPPDAPVGPVILAIHGGGFVSGSTTTHRRMFGHLARDAGVSTFAVEYGLVPKHVFPSQLGTVTSAYQWLLENGAGPVGVAGDSCGATLAVGLAVRARQDDLPMPASLLLLSAWTDLEADGASYDTGSDPFFTQELVRGLAASYLAGADPRDPLAAPMHADLRGLPPTYLQVGAQEALLDDSRRLAGRMRAAGVEVRLDEFPDQVHTFQMAAGRTTVADEAIRGGGIVAAVDTGPVNDFERAAARLRGELLAHSYRMLGSWHEAEDAVQETYLRGWRAWDGFEKRSSVRTWLHRIATNVCLNAARDRGRRALPSGIGAPTTDEVDGQPDMLPNQAWIEPFPGDHADLRLAFIAAMQTLPPAQRAVLLLRDVLAFPAAEVAEMMDMSVAAVKSSLQRARARLADADSRPDDVVEPSSPQARRLLDAYVTAFETADVDALTSALRADTTLELVPNRAWFAGLAGCSRIFASAVGRPGDWRMAPVIVNGQPGVAAYLHGEPFGIAVLDVRRDGIAGVTVFGDPGLVQRITATASS